MDLPPHGLSDDNQFHVIDGGYLLRRVVWDYDVTFREFIQRYRRYVRIRFGNQHSTIVFDGKPNGLSTKDHEHTRRNLKTSISVDTSVHLDNTIGSVSQKSFLANSNNKQAFTELLANALREDGHNVILCQGDADVSIVSSVLDVACLGQNVTLIASDADLLIMLLYMCNNLMGEIIIEERSYS